MIRGDVGILRACRRHRNCRISCRGAMCRAATHSCQFCPGRGLTRTLCGKNEMSKRLIMVTLAILGLLVMPSVYAQEERCREKDRAGSDWLFLRDLGWPTTEPKRISVGRFLVSRA